MAELEARLLTLAKIVHARHCLQFHISLEGKEHTWERCSSHNQEEFLETAAAIVATALAEPAAGAPTRHADWCAGRTEEGECDCPAGVPKATSEPKA